MVETLIFLQILLLVATLIFGYMRQRVMMCCYMICNVMIMCTIMILHN